MDISKITDEKELKAMAYEQYMVLQQCQTNLQLIQQQLDSLSSKKKPIIQTLPKEK